MTQFFSKRDPFLLCTVIFSFFVSLFVGFVFACTTTLVYNPKYICDVYFGFDNSLHETSFVRHPLLKLLSLFLKQVLYRFSAENISYFIVFVCAVLLSIQNLFIYKILHKIFQLSARFSFFLSVAFAFFGVNLLSSFTFDSYVFSGCLLSVFFYFFLKAEKENLPLKMSKFLLISILVGGITVTNFAKIILVALYSSFRKFYLKSIAVILLFSSITLLFFHQKIFNSIHFFSSHFVINQQGNFRNSTDYFLGSPFLIPKPTLSTISYTDGSAMTAILGEHFSMVDFFVLLSILASFIFLIILNLQHKIIQLLLLSFSVDILIHLVFGLGLSEAYIFAGNYSFIFPLILGFSFKKLKNRAHQKIFIYWFLFLFALQIRSNAENLFHLWNLSQQLIRQ